jgi:hypothetical protein
VWKSCDLSGDTPGDRRTKASRGEGAITLPREDARAGQDALGRGASPHSPILKEKMDEQELTEETENESALQFRELSRGIALEWNGSSIQITDSLFPPFSPVQMNFSD